VTLITDPVFYAAAVPGVLLAGVAKGGFSGGVGMFGTLILALVVPPIQAAAIMLPILCLMDLIGTWAYRRTWDRRSLVHLLPGALAGSALGALTFGLLDDKWIRLLVGGLTVVFVVDRAFAGSAGGSRPTGRPAPPRARCWAGSAAIPVSSSTPARRRPRCISCRSGSTRRCWSAPTWSSS
jgi:uncharacterized membrane protein YfcA